MSQQERNFGHRKGMRGLQMGSTNVNVSKPLQDYTHCTTVRLSHLKLNISSYYILLQNCYIKKQKKHEKWFIWTISGTAMIILICNLISK